MCASRAETAEEKLSLCPRFYKLHKVNMQAPYFKCIHTYCDNGKSITLTLCFWVSPPQRQQEIRVFSRMCLLSIKMTQGNRERKRVGKEKTQQVSDGISRGDALFPHCGR